MESIKNNDDFFAAPTPKEEIDYEAYELDGYYILNSKFYERRHPRQRGVAHRAFVYEDEKDNSSNLRAQYVSNTQELIDKLIQENFDAAIYLDKSARPVSWLVRELWPIFATGGTKPKTYYANVDSADYLDLPKSGVRPTEQEVYDYIRQLSPKHELINIVRETYRDPMDHSKSLFDGKKVLIVDELDVTGTSLLLATKIFELAFPAAKFYGYAWDRFAGKGDLINQPVWYHKGVEGRGVGDRRKPGILSEPLSEPDPSSELLRKDIKRLAKDIVDRKQPIIPIGKDESFYYEKDEKGDILTDDTGKPIPRFKLRVLPED